MKCFLPSLVSFIICIVPINSLAQTDKKTQQVDENGKRIPWYAPQQEAGQTRTEVDLSFAPTEMKMVQPSPEAARATKYSDYPVSYGIGLVDVSIPLYVVKSHSLSLPISLSYDSGGIRVDDFSGPVGLGWKLEAGGVITRSVSGEEDESTFGWAHRWEEDPIDPTFNVPGYLAEFADGTRDSSADLFSYNFCGHKGSFFIDWLSDSLDVIPTSATDLIIKVTGDGFVITDTDGTRYSFTQSERSERYITASEPVPGVGTSSYSPAYLNPITAWYLTEIASMDRTDVISLKYKKYEDFYTKHSFEPRSYLFSYQYDALGSNTYIWRDENGLWGNGYPEITCETGSYELEMDYCPQYLDSILYSGGHVAFDYIKNPIEYIPRKSYPWILNHFTVKSIPPASSSNTEIFRCTLDDTLRTRDKRNLLKEVVLTGRGGEPIESYSFTYIGEGTRAMTPNSKDLFGYYNAANNGGTAFLRLFASSYFSENMADRNYDPSTVSTLSLETISTASGAKTEFVYEGNSITTNYYGALFSKIGIGHRIHRINTYDLSGGGETLVRKRDFSYSSPGITVPEYAFVLGSFVTVNEVFREDLLEWNPSWTVKAGWHGMARSAIVVFNDQSVIPGVPLESARIFYGNVTERVSGPDFSSPSVRTDYVFDTSDAVHEYSGASWILGVSHENHDNSHNTPGYHRYHFFQRPPYSVLRMGNSQSVNFTPSLSYFIPRDLPQLTSPIVIRRYKSVGYTDTLISETVNEYELNDKKITTGYRVKNMITLGDEDYLDDDWDMEDFFRTNLEHKLIWYRLKKTTEREWLDDGSTQESVTTYTYLPASNSMSFIPTMGSVLTPKSKTTIFGSETTGGRSYSREYVYPTEIAATVPWASQIVSRGYRQAIAETITAGVGSSSASTTRSVSWNAFAPKDATNMTIYRPSSITISRREPGAQTFTNVGPNVYYEAYDRHGNVLQVKQDDEKPVSYIWGYGGLRPVLEVTGGTYDQVRSIVGSSAFSAIANGVTTSSQLINARASLESSTNPYMLLSWYLYDMPFGMTQASDISGRLTKYEYDGAGRLTTVRDKNDNRINSYIYALNNGGSGSPNSITSITHTTASSSATGGVQDVAYFDGLGRTVQTVALNASTAANGSSVLRDIVSPFVPDFLDREDAKVYIPYPASTTSSNSGSYRSNGLSSQQSYHGSGVRAYTENIYEASDRNRVIASSVPGFTETTTTQTKESPANTVLKLSFNASQNKISASGYYNNGRFVCTITEGPDGSYTEVYTDEIGTPILERVKLDATGTMADTYYIRDVLGRVICVVPPAESVQISSTTSNFLATNCYTYAYDGRDRVVNRHTPAGVVETITYNNMDLPETRSRRPADGVNVNEVFTTTYDCFNRPTLETYKYGSNAEVTLAEYMYDTYPSGAPSFSAETGYVTSSDTTRHTRGLKTTERVTLLPAGTAPSAMTSSNTSTKEFRAIYYDAKGRVRQIARTNTHGGTDRISSSYDFAGNLLKERQKIQPGSGQTTHTLDKTYQYDARLRLISVVALLDNGAAGSQTITYDDLQRTYQINRGTNQEVTTMTYTLQGWLASANSTSWEESFKYASPDLGTDPLPGKVGLITEWTQWQIGTNNNGGSTTSETYTFSYDKAGRLTGSLSYVGNPASNVNTLTERNITYDRSGNLLSLDRYDSSSGTTPSESLSYSYSGPKRTTWAYDAHANVTVDPQSGLSIAWNALDLPRTITSGTGTSSVSTQRGYLSDGSLAQISDGSTTRLYLGDMVFNKASNGTVTLESAGWEGGRLLPGSSSDKVLYMVKDHLGSVRVVKDGAGNIRQRFDYYPYGTVSRVWTSSNTTDSSEKRYRFGGKEIADSSLTDLIGNSSYLDFGARLFSPGSITWLSQDSMAEMYYHVNPYVYCVGNPINLIDPEGMYSYKVDPHGFISKIDDEGGDETDYLYGVDENGNVDKRNGVTLSDTSIMSTLLEKQTKKKGAKKPENNGVISSISTNAVAVMTAFKFLADNTTIEWAVHKSDKGEYAIGTRHHKNDSGYPFSDYGLEKVVATVHSHPGNQYKNRKEAIESMGYWNNGIIPPSDYGDFKLDYNEDGKIDRINHVYFPATHDLYRVTNYSPTYIKRINTPKNLLFGPLK